MRIPNLGGIVLFVLACAGCGGGGGGGTGGGNRFNGRGTELSGFFTYEVTESSGLYRDAWYGPQGLIGRIEVVSDGAGGVDLERVGLAQQIGSITLAPHRETKTYRGAVTYVNGPYGPAAYMDIDEVWTLAFSGSTPVLTVQMGVDDDDDDMTPPIATGTMTLRLVESVTHADPTGEQVYYGRTTMHSSDVHCLGQTAILSIIDAGSGPGSRADIDIDVGGGRSVIACEGLLRRGNTLIGGGYYDSDFGDPDWMSRFGTVIITVDGTGRPLSSTLTVWDTGTGLATTIVRQDYRGRTEIEDAYDVSYAYHDLRVDAVTPGGILEAAYGMVGSVSSREYNSSGVLNYTKTLGYLEGGYAEGSQRVFVLWNRRSYEAGNPPSHDLDDDPATRERTTVRLDIDADGIATGGTIDLETFDAHDAATGTESMSFTLPLSP